MEKMSRILFYVAAITLALVCVANSKVVPTTGEPDHTASGKWCMCPKPENCKKCKPGTYAADPKDKTKFYQCGQGCYDVMSCKSGTVWNETIVTCVPSTGPTTDYTLSTEKVKTTVKSKHSGEPSEVTATGSLLTGKLTTDGKTIVTDSSNSTNGETSSHSYDTTPSGRQTSHPGHSTQSPAKQTTTEPSHHSTDKPSHHSTDKPAGWCYCNKTYSDNCKPCIPGNYTGDPHNPTKFYHCGASECFETKFCQNSTIWDQNSETCIHTATATPATTEGTSGATKIHSTEHLSSTVVPHTSLPYTDTTETSTPVSSDEPSTTVTATVHSTEQLSSTTETHTETTSLPSTHHAVTTAAPGNKTDDPTQSTSSPSHPTTTPANLTTPTPANHTTPTPANHTTPTPANHTTPTPGNHTTPTPGNHTTPTPGNHTTPTPGNHTTPIPGNHTTATPGHKTTDHQSTVTSSAGPATTEKSSFDGGSFGGGIALGIGVAIVLLGLVYLFYYCRKPTPDYEQL